MKGAKKGGSRRSATRRAYLGPWVSVDAAAALTGTTTATVKSWIRRGAVTSTDLGGIVHLRLDEVVGRAASGLGRHLDADVLMRQVEAGLTELEASLREAEKLRLELASTAQDVATLRAELERVSKRETWGREQHDRELRDTYSRWEQERAGWQRERAALTGERDGEPVTLTARPLSHDVGDRDVEQDGPMAEVVPIDHSRLTSRPPIADEVLPPLQLTPSTGELLEQGIIAPLRPRRRWRLGGD